MNTKQILFQTKINRLFGKSFAAILSRCFLTPVLFRSYGKSNYSSFPDSFHETKFNSLPFTVK